MVLALNPINRMIRIPTLAVVAVAGLFAATMPVSQSPTEGGAAAERLSSELVQVIRGTGWPSDRWSVMVVSLDGGDTLFAHEPDADLTPASNLKLFTTAAALHYLGPDYRYGTYLVATGPIRDGVLEGDLLIYGTGDPTVSGRYYEEETPVWEALADTLAELGVQRITGDVIGDASYFEGSGVGRGWQSAYITHTYAAYASALSYNDNVATLRVTPGPAVGTPPNIQVLPGGVVAVRNEARTVTSGRTRIEVQRESYDAPVVLTGQIQQGSSAVWRAFPVADPAHFAASALGQLLVKRGIQIAGKIRSTYDAEASPVTGRRVYAPALEDGPGIQVLAVHLSPPLLDILTVINRRSHNLYADAVLRTVGRVATGHGSARGGEAAVHAMLSERSPSVSRVQLDDGSGLSTLNRASSRSFVELLGFMQESEFRDAYLSTLPEAAVDRGLRRMHRTPAAGNLRAKTGTIDNVSALSGYVRAANGELLAFSILSNDVPSTWGAKRIEDRMGARLASFDRPPPRLAAASPTEPPDEEAAPEPTATPSEEQPAEVAAEMSTEPTTTYVVKSGDTLTGIARSNGVTLEQLEAANPGLNPRRLMPGQELRIP